MKAIYTRYETSNLLENFGEDVVHFQIYFKTDELPEVAIGVLFPYSALIKFVREANPPVYEYLTQIRSSMAGYGPKETKVLAQMEEEGFDLEPLLKEYFYSKDTLFVSQHLEWVERMNAPKAQEQAGVFLEQITDQLGESYASEQIKWDKFIDELDQTIHEVTFRYYPEIFENGPEKIEAYRNALYFVTTSFASRIDKILK
ncbi:hypothetical protein [Flavobacterium tegetincola]|uniref:hypothetical protein n=1 Tax=Flavobacterium tegetincola TaxID=150172 RepID=UPI00040C124C|nr:hypothetical protein [Flavobacterium tegetincola]